MLFFTAALMLTSKIIDCVRFFVIIEEIYHVQIQEFQSELRHKQSICLAPVLQGFFHEHIFVNSCHAVLSCYCHFMSFYCFCT